MREPGRAPRRQICLAQATWVGMRKGDTDGDRGTETEGELPSVVRPGATGTFPTDWGSRKRQAGSAFLPFELDF